MNLVYWGVLSFLGVVCAFFAGKRRALKDIEMTTPLILLAFLLLFWGGHFAFKQGNKEERVMDSVSTYLVVGKGQSTFGTPLLVRDMILGDDFVIVTKEYPPSGFVEATTADGKMVILLPSEKK